MTKSGSVARANGALGPMSYAARAVPQCVSRGFWSRHSGWADPQQSIESNTCVGHEDFLPRPRSDWFLLFRRLVSSALLLATESRRHKCPKSRHMRTAIESLAKSMSSNGRMDLY